MYYSDFFKTSKHVSSVIFIWSMFTRKLLLLKSTSKIFNYSYNFLFIIVTQDFFWLKWFLKRKVYLNLTFLHQYLLCPYYWSYSRMKFCYITFKNRHKIIFKFFLNRRWILFIINTNSFPLLCQGVYEIVLDSFVYFPIK